MFKRFLLFVWEPLQDTKLITSYPAELGTFRFNDTMSNDRTVDTGADLSLAIGGAEASCSRCCLPFTLFLLIIGVSVTVVAYSFNSHGSTISILGLLLLSAGLLLLALTAVCRQCRRKTDSTNRESQTDLVESCKKS
ncbi:hypothetical protein DNTS_027977 [Danionella cerebrum]|uniref:Transmembrane protein 100 n=1 Tax=Danionella cerebrum TaxID=2873325 RepID=A0A553QWI2_9TELE|nr:hypothetical protein DNTS_027977 [Danionella translucida]